MNNYQYPQNQYMQNNYTPVRYAPAPEKEYPVFTKKDAVFSALYLLSSFLLIDFCIQGIGLGFTVFYLLHFAITAAYAWKSARKIGAFSLICGAISCCACVVLSLFNDGMVNFFLVIMILGLYGMFVFGVFGCFKHSTGSFRICTDLAKDAFVSVFADFGLLFGSIKKSSNKNKKAVGSFLGAVIAVPVLAIIIPLLSNADAAFEGLVKSVLSNIGKYIAEFIGAVVIFPYVFSYVFGKKYRKSQANSKPRKNSDSKIQPSACISFLSVISCVYVVYLFSQLAYFFSAFKGLLPDGYKYSASTFARRGFFEMFVICVINIILLSAAGYISKSGGKKLLLAQKLLSCFIAVFSILLIVCAMQKMRLNIATYALSKNRLLVCVFMVMLLVVMIFFIIHIFAPKVPYMRFIVVFCSVLFTVMAFADIDSKIADYNINAYLDSKINSVDTESLCELSDSAVESLVSLAKSDSSSAQNAMRAVAKKASNDFSSSFSVSDGEFKQTKKDSDFRTYCRSHTAAEEAIFDYYTSLSDSEQAAFRNVFVLSNDEKYYYNSESDSYYSYSDNAEYEFDKESGLYEKQPVYDSSEDYEFDEEYL